MPRLRRLVILSLLVSIGAVAQAQTRAPGLWEHTIGTASGGGEQERMMAIAQQQIAALPPEQRRQAEQMMAKNGVSLSSGGVTIKACISPEQAARPAEATLPESCTQHVEERRGNSVKFRYQCTRPRPLSGEADVTFASDKAYAGKSTMTTEIAGAPRQVSTTMSGRWLGPDCGDLKPVPTSPG